MKSDQRAQTLSSIFMESKCRAPEQHPFFYRAEQLSRFLTGADIILYEAERDAEPPLQDPLWGLWRLDRVVYTGQPLPTGELNRSVGHWNLPDQHEIFEVLSGRVHFLTVPPDRSIVFHTTLETGGLVHVPPGWWHLTCIESSEAEVVNIYSGEECVQDKYFRSECVPVGLIWKNGVVEMYSDRIPWQVRPGLERMNLGLGKENLREYFYKATTGTCEPPWRLFEALKGLSLNVGG